MTLTDLQREALREAYNCAVTDRAEETSEALYSIIKADEDAQTALALLDNPSPGLRVVGEGFEWKKLAGESRLADPRWEGKREVTGGFCYRSIYEADILPTLRALVRSGAAVVQEGEA